MNEQMVDILMNVKTRFNEDLEKSDGDISTIEKFFAECVWKKDFSHIEHITKFLEVEFLDEVEDENELQKKSYILGKIHAMIEIANYLSLPREVEEKVQQLTQNQQKLLTYIFHEGQVTPSQINTALEINNKQLVSNVLRELRLKDLIYVIPAGKKRWYTISPLGKEVIGHYSEIGVTVEEKVLDHKDSMEVEHKKETEREKPLENSLDQVIFNFYHDFTSNQVKYKNSWKQAKNRTVYAGNAERHVAKDSSDEIAVLIGGGRVSHLRKAPKLPKSAGANRIIGYLNTNVGEDYLAREDQGDSLILEDYFTRKGDSSGVHRKGSKLFDGSKLLV